MKYDVVKNCYELINSLQHSGCRENFSSTSYIKEYRTIGMILPRQSGKTNLLNTIRKRESSILFVYSYNTKELISQHDPSIVVFSSIGRLEDSFRGKNVCGLKYTCFLIDEPDQMTPAQKENLFSFIDFLSRMNMLSNDFFILKLGT